MYHLNDLNFQMSKKASNRPLQRRSSTESSSEESDADDDSSVHASQWKRNLAKPTEADSSDDGRRRSKSSRKSSRSDSGKKGRRDADYDSEDQALVPSGSRRSGNIPAEYCWPLSPRPAKDGVMNPRGFLMIQCVAPRSILS